MTPETVADMQEAKAAMTMMKYVYQALVEISVLLASASAGRVNKKERFGTRNSFRTSAVELSP